MLSSGDGVKRRLRLRLGQRLRDDQIEAQLPNRREAAAVERVGPSWRSARWCSGVP